MPPPRLPPKVPLLRRIRRWLLFLVVLSGFCGMVYLARGPLLRAFGRWWVVDEPPVKSQAIVVIGGDSVAGARVRHAIELYRQGWAPKLVFSGELFRTDFCENVLMQTQAIHDGVPQDAIVLAPCGAYTSTLTETLALRSFLTEDKINHIILVTSNFHTRRAQRIVRAILDPAGFAVRISAARDERFPVDHWWQAREGKKALVLELLKSFQTWRELRNLPPPATPAPQSTTPQQPPGPGWHGVCSRGGVVNPPLQ